MARVTVEDCLAQVPNRFALTVLASRRARALSEGKGTPLVKSSNKVGVISLREIAKGNVRYEEDVEGTIANFIEEQRAQLMAGSSSDATFIDAASFGTGEDEDEEDDDVKELTAELDQLQDDDDDDDDADADSEDESTDDDDDDADVDDADVDASMLEDIDDLDDEDENDDDDDDDDDDAGD